MVIELGLNLTDLVPKLFEVGFELRGEYVQVEGHYIAAHV
jgi:hypothetical protein